ncbi:MAG TPA: glycosyltransferase [Thermoguttaceae bacterium]|nr:glycosyltransferase [Thermoguttaceae bacterium]
MKPTSGIPVDLVIPVYNEAHVLEGSVCRLAAAMADVDFQWRIVVVNNGSTDETLCVARRLAERFDHVECLHLDLKGRGRALRKTWSETDAEFSLYMDADLSTELAAVPRVVERLRQGADLVTGSRLHADSHITRCFQREVLSRNYNRLIRWMLRTRSFDDAQCGFKGVRIETVRPLLPLVRDQEWFFDTELLVLAEYAGLSIHNLPITWVEDPDSRVNIPKTIWQDLRGLTRLRRTVLRRSGLALTEQRDGISPNTS